VSTIEPFKREVNGKGEIMGWWAEGYNGKNGWAIGEERGYDNDDE
jgi:hypothetical protein